MRAFPVNAREAGVSGRAVMRCLVAADRRLVNCAVVEEAPEGRGFGDATVRLGAKFKAAPTSKSGRPTVGREILVKLTWSLG